jgi:hypothetical protein
MMSRGVLVGIARYNHLPLVVYLSALHQALISKFDGPNVVTKSTYDSRRLLFL